MKVRIFIVDDHPVLRSGLCLLINGQRDMVVVGEAGEAPSALEAVQKLLPDIILMDLAMNGHMHIDTIGELRKCCPSGYALILTMHTESGYVRESLAPWLPGMPSRVPLL